MTRIGEERYEHLRMLNGFMGALHLLQASLIFILSNSFSLPVTASHLITSPANPELQTEVLFNLEIGPLIAIFLLISAIAHFSIFSFLYNWYIEHLRKHINHLRWIEYSLSASIMIVAIAMLTGIFDIGALILLFVVNASMIFFGWMMEIHNQKTEETEWAPFIFGCIAGIAPWLVIAIYLLGGVFDPATTLPTFVIGIYISIAVFFNIFALNQYLQYREVGPWKNYVFGEKMYIVLSLVAKSALAWQVFAGTLMG